MISEGGKCVREAERGLCGGGCRGWRAAWAPRGRAGAVSQESVVWFRDDTTDAETSFENSVLVYSLVPTWVYWRGSLRTLRAGRADSCWPSAREGAWGRGRAALVFTPGAGPPWRQPKPRREPARKASPEQPASWLVDPHSSPILWLLSLVVFHWGCMFPDFSKLKYFLWWLREGWQGCLTLKMP